jgi:hypothetical protein
VKTVPYEVTGLYWKGPFEESWARSTCVVSIEDVKFTFVYFWHTEGNTLSVYVSRMRYREHLTIWAPYSDFSLDISPYSDFSLNIQGLPLPEHFEGLWRQALESLYV